MSRSRRARLRRRLWVGGPDGEKGAVAVAVALLFPLLIGAAALAVDTAAVWTARAQVISGADAVVLAEAMDCAAGDCGTKEHLAEMITQYYVANNAGAKLASLRPGTGWLQTDPNQKATLTVGDWTIQHYFAAVLGSAVSNLSVSSMARWSGAPSADADLPLAVSLCAYQAAATKGVGSTAAALTLSLSTVSSGNSCKNATGATVTGTTTLTAPTGSVCGTSSTAGSTTATAASAPAACSVSYLNGLVGDDVWIPVYDQIGGGTVRVYGYAALRVTSVTTGSPATVSGYLVWSGRQINTPDGVPTAPDLGGRAVFLWNPDLWQGTRCPC